MGLFFYPRGGSAHVARSLAQAAPSHGIALTLAAGSQGEPGEPSHAPTFFAGFDVQPVEVGLDEPQRPAIAFLPTYEEGASAGERLIARVDERSYERIVEAWIVALRRACSQGVDILHLHHLTPIHEAALRAFADVPIVTQLHGTELALLERIERGCGPPLGHARAWAERMRSWANASARVIVSAPALAEEARALLGLERDRLICLANGVDTNTFACRPLSPEARCALWQRWLGEEPRAGGPVAGPAASATARQTSTASATEPRSSSTSVATPRSSVCRFSSTPGRACAHNAGATPRSSSSVATRANTKANTRSR